MPKPKDDVSISALLLHHYLRYQERLGRTVTVKEFARYLNIHEKEYSAIYHKKRTFTVEKAEQFAKTLDDLRFYDAAGSPRPNEVTYRLEREWDVMPDEYKKIVSDAVAKYMAEKIRDSNQ